MKTPALRVKGLVELPLTLEWEQLQQLPDSVQVSDVSQLVPGRTGQAVRLEAILHQAQVAPSATHLGLHATRDNFHASIPLDAVRARGLVVYARDGCPLSAQDGGPFRLLIVDFAACHSSEIDECANVKFLDEIELTSGKGFDNRPQDEDEHARLHANEPSE